MAGGKKRHDLPDDIPYKSIDHQELHVETGGCRKSTKMSKAVRRFFREASFLHPLREFDAGNR
jgi:hypothetical protein